MKHGFTAVCRPGRVEVRLHRPKADGQYPLLSFACDDEGGAVLFGCLYYQDELRARLGKSRADGCRDAALALAAFRRWGEGAAVRLEGDLAVVFWDARCSSLVAARDPLGGYPLFWTTRGETIAIGTSLFDLLDLRPGRDLDPEYLADFLALAGPQNEVGGERTAFQGIHRVLAGHVVRAETRTGRVCCRAYWDWREHIEDPGTDRLEEVAPRYGEVLRAAVRERLRGRTLSHLSGGMDSTSVALLAGDAVSAGHGAAPLHTLSLVYERLPQLARERQYIDKVLGRETGLVAHCLPADDLLDFDAFADPPPHEEPYAGLWRTAMDRATFTVAAQHGVSTVLTGCGADELLDGKPYHLADLLRRGRLFAAWREAGRWAYHLNCNAWEVLGPFGLGRLRAWLPRRLGGVGRSAGADLSEQTEAVVGPWIAPSFARRWRLGDRMRAAARKPYRCAGKAATSTAIAALADRPGDVLRWAVAAPLGIACAHPFQDRRVLALGLGVLDRIPPQPGRMKPLLAAALAGRLPAHVTARRAKGHFSEIFYLGLSRNLPRLEALVRDAPLDDLGVLERAPLVNLLEGASLGGRNCRQMHPMTLALSLACWLTHRRDWQRNRPPPAEVVLVGNMAEFSGGSAGERRPPSIAGAGGEPVHARARMQ